MPLAFGQTDNGPESEHVGTGSTSTVKSQVLVQVAHPTRVIVNVSLNDPALPAVTVTESTVDAPTIVPLPVIVHW
jgi:hypothetical protein